MSSVIDALSTSFFETRVPRDSRTFWVSELTWCLRKAYLDRTSPRNVGFGVQIVREMGTAVHRLVAAVLKSRGFEAEVPVARVVASTALVKGRVDAIIFEDNGIAVLEVKTSDDTNIREDFARQARFYAAILGVSTAYVLVVNRGDGSYAIHRLSVEVEEAFKELEERVVKLKKALDEGKEPEPERGPWCKWCPYRSECPAWKNEESRD